MSEFRMGLRPTYMDETHLESMSFYGVDGDTPGTARLSLHREAIRYLQLS
jgi:hypothetical protein